MQVLSTVDTSAITLPSTSSIGGGDVSKTTVSMCSAAHENGSYALVLNNANETSTSSSSSSSNKNIVGIYKILADKDSYINCRHQFALDVPSTFVGNCITATTPYHQGATNNNNGNNTTSWVVVGGSDKNATTNQRTPALWLSPMMSSSEKSVARSSTVIPIPTTSNSKASTAISHAAFISSSEVVCGTTDGRFGIFDVSTAQLSSPGPALAAIPGFAGMRPTCILPAEDPSTFFVSTGRLIARVDTRTPQSFISHRPAQMWLWHPHDRISSVNFESFTSSRELVCGSDEGTVMLFDTRSPQQQNTTSSSSSQSPWQVNPRPGCSISGVGRVAGSGSICVSWNDCIIGSVDVVTAPNSESKSTIRVISKNDEFSGGVGKVAGEDAAAHNSNNNNNNSHQLLSTPPHEFSHDSAVSDNGTGSVVLCQDKNVAVVGTRRGTLSVVGYR